MWIGQANVPIGWSPARTEPCCSGRTIAPPLKRAGSSGRFRRFKPADSLNIPLWGGFGESCVLWLPNPGSFDFARFSVALPPALKTRGMLGKVSFNKVDDTSDGLFARAANSCVCAFAIVDPERNAVIVAEIKFREIAIQVLFLVLINAFHAAFEN